MNKPLHFIFLLLSKEKKTPSLISQRWTNSNFRKGSQIAIWFAVLFFAFLGTPLSSSSHTIADPPERKVHATPIPLDIILLFESDFQTVYDGNTSVYIDSLPFGYLTADIVPGDDVWYSGTGTLDDPNVGSYNRLLIFNQLTLHGKDKDKYVITSVNVRIIVSVIPKPLTISIKPNTIISKVYDGSTSVPITIDDFTFSGELANEQVSATTLTAVYADKNAGTEKNIIITNFTLSGADKNNYTLPTSSELKGSITPKPLSITLLSESNISKIYDGTTEASLYGINYSLSEIIAEDDVVVNAELSSASYETKHVGSNKKIIATGLTLSGLHASNYQLAQNTAEASIGIILPREISLICLPQTKQYGSSDPELTYNIQGMLGNDVLTGHLERSTGNDVGEYSISVGTLSAEDYICSSFTPSIFTITPASLTITAENKVRNQGEINPNFTFKYDGFVNGDTFSDLDSPPTAFTAAASGSPSGDYNIEVAGATASNYTISFVSGKLTVLPVEEEKQVRVGSTSRNAVQINVYADVPQRAAIILYNSSGQPMVVEQKRLGTGNNSYTLPVSNLSAGSYTLRVKAEKFNNAQNLNVR